MKPVHQTKFGPKEGNCFQAVFASIFEIPIKQVPDFEAKNGYWLINCNKWLAEKFNLSLVMIPYKLLSQTTAWMMCDHDGYYLWAGKSSRRIDHIVIAQNGKMVHDPYPGGDGLVDVEEVWIFATLDPAQLTMPVVVSSTAKHKPVPSHEGDGKMSHG